ncbi:MAG: chemotaxis protein CheB [Myxococcaceae bacterium]
MSRVNAIVIGGSAGALDVLEQVLPQLRPGFAVPVVIAVHLLPTRPSVLAALLGAWCPLPVSEADDKEPLSPGHVYVAAPNYHLLVERDHSFSLSVDEPVHFSRPSIDVLFESAAEAYRDRLLGVLLSGANEDGVCGMRAIAAAGGRTVVQSPESSREALMPRAALAAMRPDEVLNPSRIGEAMAHLAGGLRNVEATR